MFIKKMKFTHLTNLLFTEKNNLAVLESEVYKSNNIFYIVKNKFIRITPL
jgi:hypothetical protein